MPRQISTDLVENQAKAHQCQWQGLEDNPEHWQKNQDKSPIAETHHDLSVPERAAPMPLQRVKVQIHPQEIAETHRAALLGAAIPGVYDSREWQDSEWLAATEDTGP